MYQISVLFRLETFSFVYVWEVIGPKLFVFLSSDPAINNELANDIIN